MCVLSFWFCIEPILATVSPMEHKRDATVAGLGWPSNPNRGSSSTESAPESGRPGFGTMSSCCPPLLRPRPLRHLWKPILPPTTSELRPKPIHTQPPHFLMYLSRQSPSPTYKFFHRSHFSSRVVHQIHFKIITHSNNTRGVIH